MNCPKCHEPIAAGHRFCVECGTKIDEMDNVGNFIMWNVQPGQIARLIPEKEFLQYSDAEGLIVNEGTSVLVRLNASDYTMISSGIYRFPKLSDGEEQDSGKEKKGFFAFIKKLFGLSKEPVYMPPRIETCSVLLIRDGEFPVIFGGLESTGDNFVPMVIPAGNLDLDVGLSVMLRIGSMRTFMSHYLLDRVDLGTSGLVNILAPKVEKVLRDVLADVTVSENSLDKEVVARIETALKALSPELGGVEIAGLEDIRVGHKALERFRDLNSELYLSDRELDYLNRTNEFKNRLTAAQNAQTLNEARSELSLLRGLQEINKDKLLLDDELDKFYTLLSREKRIRDARSEEEIAAALADIEKTGLIRNEDLNELKDEIRRKEHERGHSFRMMQKKDELQLASLQREYDKRIREEDYEFEKRRKDDEFDRFKEMFRLKEEKDNAEHQRNMAAMEAMRTAKIEKYKASRDLTPEQLMAIAANENLSSEAAVRFAESLGKAHDAEAERARQEELNRLNQARIDDMKDMMRMMHPQQPAYPSGPYQDYLTQPSSPSKFCVRCGNKMPADARFCSVCGTPVN